MNHEFDITTEMCKICHVPRWMALEHNILCSKQSEKNDAR